MRRWPQAGGKERRFLQRPMMDMLRAASERLSLHMPGGQGAGPFGTMDPYLLDTTEQTLTDDLYEPTGAIVKAQELAAKSAGAAHTLMLSGGSTAGMHAMLLYAAGRGDQVILPRNVHISALHLCAVAGIEPVFVPVCYTAAGRPYATPEAYQQVMEAYPFAKAALVLSPDYYGTLGPVEEVARLAHEKGMLVLCDEAHGAAMNWVHPENSALRRGADLVIQSAHKTLPALTASAWLHTAENIDITLLRKRLRMVQTSSPSFIIMLALDDARAWMDEHGAQAGTVLEEALTAFRREAARLGYTDGQKLLPPGMKTDPLRLVLDAPQGGFRLAEQLEELGIDVELSDAAGIGCILSLMDGPRRLEKLLDALRVIAQQEQMARDTTESHQKVNCIPAAAIPAPPPIPPRKMPLHEAAFAPAQSIAISDAAGRISAGQVGLYPPGVAVLSAGEEITPEIVRWLTCMPKDKLFGLDEHGRLTCVREGV